MASTRAPGSSLSPRSSGAPASSRTLGAPGPSSSRLAADGQGKPLQNLRPAGDDAPADDDAPGKPEAAEALSSGAMEENNSDVGSARSTDSEVRHAPLASHVPAPTATAPRFFPRGRRSWCIAALTLGALASLGSMLTASSSIVVVPVLGAVAACAALLASAPGRVIRRAPLAPALATAATVLCWALAPANAAQAAGLAGVVCAVTAGSTLWIGRRQQAFEPVYSRLREGLSEPMGEVTAASGERPRKPGEELVLRAGDRLRVDAVIQAGRAQVQPWSGAACELARGEDDGLVAGARIVDGALRAVVRWVGDDRAWARLTLDPSRRADRHSAPARLAEQLATLGAAGLALAAALVALSLDVHPLLALGYAAAAAAALGNVGLRELVALHVSGTVFQLLERGVCFRNPAALDRAGRTTSVVFCDRGTLLAGQFGIASIEPFGDVTENDLLSLLAGAHAGVPSPLGAALQRAIHAQKLRPDAVRSPDHLPGLGVTAVASNGQALVAGTRALLLEKRTSVAAAETRIGELEALGRTVLLVALDGRAVGLVALQDSMRPGARAATQCLIDAGVEPVLLSGEARETCRALARHIGIEHVRPEVLPHDRAAEVRRLAGAGGVLAVVGSSIDDAALAAAPLSINIDARGGPLDRCDIAVVSGDVRDAALAVQLARDLHAVSRSVLITAAAPLAVGVLSMFAGIPAWVLPMLGWVGTLVGARRLGEPPRAGV
jgi:P-type Cu+ transporter